MNKIRKILAMVLAAGMSASLMACGSSSAGKAEATAEVTTAAAASEAAQERGVAVASDKKDANVAGSLGDFKMIVGHAQPEGNPRFVSLEKFAADVEEKTGGHVKVTVYGNGQLGTEKEMLEQVVQGTIQGMRGGQFDFCPRLQMFTAPFMTQTRKQVTALLKSDLAKKVSEEAEKETGTVIINLCDAGGYRQFSNNIRPVKKPDDLKGLKISTNGMKTYDLAFQTMGASTVTIPYADLYMSLKTGVADGQDNSWGNVVSMKFYEVQKYIIKTEHVLSVGGVACSSKCWDSLDAETQAAVTEAVEYILEAVDKATIDGAPEQEKFLEEQGCEVVTVEDKAPFKDRAYLVPPSIHAASSSPSALWCDCVCPHRRYCTLQSFHLPSQSSPAKNQAG